jgi:hypothetical protein
MKSRFTIGLFFGLMMAIVYITTGLVNEPVYTTNNVMLTITGGLIGGTVAGFLFGWLLKFNYKRKQSDNRF